MAKSDEATFAITIDGNAAKSTEQVASSARLAAKAIGDYENEIKVLSGDLRRLKGNTDDVKAAKAALKKRIDDARSSVSTLTTELTKQNTSYAAAAAAVKKYGDGVGRLPNLRAALGKGFGKAGDIAGPIAGKLANPFAKVGKQISSVLGPVAKKVGDKIAPAGGRLEKFAGGAKKAFAGVGKAVKQDLVSVLPSGSAALSALGTAGKLAAGASLAAVAAIGAAGAAVVAFGLSSADSAAKLGRQRQALLGNAEDAGRLGDQIQALAGKVPQGVDELNALSVSLAKTKLSGNAIVSTMNAVAQATGAVDAEAGSKIQELVTRGQQSGRFFLNRLELQGTGIDFDDVAREYAVGTKKGLDAAKAELARGAVPLEAGADALAKATAKKFGALNMKNAFSLENAPKKFFERIQSLSSGVDLEPLTKGFQDAFAQLSPDAPLGAAVKSFMSTIGTGFIDLAAKSIPLVLDGFKYLILAGLKLATVYYETKKAIKDAFEVGDWVGLGKAIIDGIIKGFEVFDGGLGEASRNLGTKIRKAFTGELKIQSPSKVFAKYGEYTTEGYAQGVDNGTKRATGAVTGMAESVSAAGANAPGLSQGGAPASGGGDTIEVHFHNAPLDSVAQLTSAPVLAMLVRAVRDARTASGISAAVPGTVTA